ncbi:hypothetical protein [Dipodfec virus UOA04_Rod_760]|nr:hypothetical protein [Dipodfec virus UOA04_Rod_760]
MSFRRKLSNATSRNIFIKGALKTHSKNLTPTLMRGGYRL